MERKECSGKKCFLREFGALTCATLMLGAGNAAAQSGSRLCGFKTTGTEPAIPGFAVAIVYEARTARWSYTKECDEAIDRIRKKRPDYISHTLPNGESITVKLIWKKVRKDSCESVGKDFAGEGIGNDICDHMKARKAYTVVKAPGQAASFEKQ